MIIAQGFSVALNADGNTALVGGVVDNTDFERGATWVFVRDGFGVWTQQGNKLVGTGTAASTRQGSSVALSADGNVAVVGGPSDAANTGAVWVFVRYASGQWGQVGSKLVGNGVRGPRAKLGVSVAISGSGTHMLVGGESDANDQGSVWAFACV